MRVIIKADVQGSLGAILDSLEKLSTPEIHVTIIHKGGGGINESDIMLAAVSDSIIIGFNIRPEPAAQVIAEREGVEIRTYRIIYEIIEEVRAAMEGLLEPLEKDIVVKITIFAFKTSWQLDQNKL